MPIQSDLSISEREKKIGFMTSNANSKFNLGLFQSIVRLHGICRNVKCQMQGNLDFPILVSLHLFCLSFF